MMNYQDLFLFTIREVTEAVKNIEKVNVEFKDVYNKAKERFVNRDDGNVTKRIVDYIFNNTDAGLNIIKHQDAGKKKILIYPGGMMNNGITSSFINLMDNIDFTKYDVSILMNTPTSKEVLINLDKVNRNARFLFRNGLALYSIVEVYRDKLVHNRGAHTNFTKSIYPEQAYKREIKRYFGRARFDIAIDFSGYSLFWAKYLLASDAKKKICYMHNDLLSDSERTINERRPHRINLRGLFSVYNRFDKLVSVSIGTMELNKKNLSKYADESKFDYVMNSINVGKILRLSNEGNLKKPVERVDSTQLFSFTPFKSRAIIINPKGHFVWNRPLGLFGSVQVTHARQYINKEVMILSEACTEAGVFYKFAVDDRIEGWLNQECFELLSDSILSEKVVNKSMILQNVSGNSIWNLPYYIEGNQKVSSSKDYKGVLVVVDVEARTQHGSYSRFSINGTQIGWIDSSALKMIHKENRISSVIYKLWKLQRQKSETNIR
ncbi:GW domain-containing glycosaminoglycan-binding protein [Neobacillus mesonae]|uniref:GW domain-containing glycosaminoglycan-binding protein n=1 Tax=Neobacillus mesonae TaxID=1193713 RepID=UPI002573D263|nr:GW domain-containing glycosaminoglycan-binding protein [Neobacillus mesonae]